MLDSMRVDSTPCIVFGTHHFSSGVTDCDRRLAGMWATLMPRRSLSGSDVLWFSKVLGYGGAEVLRLLASTLRGPLLLAAFMHASPSLDLT